MRILSARYYARRQKNNIACRRSRMKKRAEEIQIEQVGGRVVDNSARKFANSKQKSNLSTMLRSFDFLWLLI